MPINRERRIKNQTRQKYKKNSFLKCIIFENEEKSILRDLCYQPPTQIHQKGSFQLWFLQLKDPIKKLLVCMVPIKFISRNQKKKSPQSLEPSI